MKKIRLQQNQEEQENKLANYIDNRTPLKGYEKKTPKTQNSMTNQERKRKIRNSTKNEKLIYAHNFTLKFPLHSNCRIPFTDLAKQVRLRNNSFYLFKTNKALFKQTTRNLFVTPSFKTLPAIPGNSLELQAVMKAKCMALTKALMQRFIGLRVIAPNPVPSTQEYAVKDSFARKLPFTYKNRLGKFDKSVRIEADGHKVTGGEIEYFTPEHADLYLEMPLRFAKVTDSFSEALAGYKEQIVVHLDVLQDMKRSLRAMSRAGAPGAARMPTAFRKSATVRGVA